MKRTIWISVAIGIGMAALPILSSVTGILPDVTYYIWLPGSITLYPIAPYGHETGGARAIISILLTPVMNVLIYSVAAYGLIRLIEKSRGDEHGEGNLSKR